MRMIGRLSQEASGKSRVKTSPVICDKSSLTLNTTLGGASHVPFHELSAGGFPHAPIIPGPCSPPAEGPPPHPSMPAPGATGKPLDAVHHPDYGHLGGRFRTRHPTAG